ncbi:MAG TPA: 16S rRNA (guanine(966)-N(2))-methyltransferase RsmD [Candidatus Acidoferrales bacterium]|nr:16S rRNA (guanine(966)-N(2))-methyltransferase RsmD [Candidatus Acidoferrales bacterium]
MRVIAGKFKSRRLRTLRGMSLRPTSDRLRETLFDILGAAVEGSICVDLFAGTGAIGIEAISRGAQRVVFVENHAAAVKLIRDNLKSLDIVSEAVSEAASEAEILPMDAIRGLEKFVSQRAHADFIFLDPPYAHAEEYERVLEFINSKKILAATGMVIAEHAKKINLPERMQSLRRTRVLAQGDSALSFYRNAEN